MADIKGKAMVNFGTGIPWEMREYPVPDPEPDAVVTKITMSSICGSDLHIYKGDFDPPGAKGKRQPPKIGGHEFVGKVYKLGENVKTDFNGQPLKEGDRVVWCYYVPCGRCASCVSGLGPCPNRHSHASMSSDEWPHFKGGFAEYYYVSPGQWIYKVPDTVPDEAVVFVDCATSTVAYGLEKVSLPLSATTVIQGAGGLGLSTTPIAKDMGSARVIVIDGIPDRLELAKTFGADYTININEYKTPEARIKKVKEISGGRGADLVVEVVASSPEVVPEGLEMLGLGGTYLTMGLVGPFSAKMGMGTFIDKGVKLIGSANYRSGTIPKVLDFIARTIDKYPFDKIISHKFKLEDVEEAYKQMLKGKVVRAAVVFE